MVPRRGREREGGGGGHSPVKKVSNAETDDYVEINITWIIFWFNHQFCLDNFFLEAITITINIVPFYVYDCEIGRAHV